MTKSAISGPSVASIWMRSPSRRTRIPVRRRMDMQVRERARALHRGVGRAHLEALEGAREAPARVGRQIGKMRQVAGELGPAHRIVGAQLRWRGDAHARAAPCSAAMMALSNDGGRAAEHRDGLAVRALAKSIASWVCAQRSRGRFCVMKSGTWRTPLPSMPVANTSVRVHSVRVRAVVLDLAGDQAVTRGGSATSRVLVAHRNAEHAAIPGEVARPDVGRDLVELRPRRGGRTAPRTTRAARGSAGRDRRRRHPSACASVGMRA